MRYSLAFILPAAIVMVAGCRQVVDTSGRISTRVEADRGTAVIGEPVQLRGIATNRGESAVHLGLGCSPGLDFEITFPGGERRRFSDGLVFTCELKDSNVLEAGETDTVAVQWIPARTGWYSIRAGVLESNRLHTLSSPVLVTVKASPREF